MPRYAVFTKARPGTGLSGQKFRGIKEAPTAKEALRRMRANGELSSRDDVVYCIPNIGRFQYNKKKGTAADYNRPK